MTRPSAPDPETPPGDEAEAAARPTTRWSDGRVWLAVFAVTTALGWAWAVSSPLMASPDEPAQTVRAAAVVRGQLGGTETVVRQTDEHVMNIVRAEVTLPRGYGELDGARLCYGFYPHITANCATPISTDPAEGPATTYVGRYPPPYHALVGWPSLVLGTERAIWAMRLLSVVLAAAFIATAAMAARRVRGAALVLVGVLLAVTPEVLFLAASVNPSALEIPAALAAWTTVLALAAPTTGRAISRTDPRAESRAENRTESRAESRVDTRATTPAVGQGDHAAHREADRAEDRRVGHPERSLVIGATASLAALAWSRPLSPLFVVLIVVVVWAFAGTRERARALLADRSVRIGGAVAAIALGGATAWAITSQALSSGAGFPITAASNGELVRYSVDELPYRTRQMVGVFGWLDTELSPTAIAVWLGLVVALVAVALVLGRWRERLTIVALVGGTLGLVTAAEVIGARTVGTGWQGRYTLPLAVGLPVLAGAAIDRSGRLARRVTRPMSITVVVATAAVQLVALATSVRRYSVGVDHPLLAYLQDSAWAPPGGQTVVFAASVLAAAAYAAGWGLILRAPGPDG